MNDLSENGHVQIRLLLGPAGTGKTFRCLEEIRAELRRTPEGPPLLFIAPKQATFQIERQLLADHALAGYTRLQILSFDRLAEFVLDGVEAPAREVLSEQGRVMVLRALLAEKHTELRLFRSTARLPGFAQQLSALLRELQQHRLSAERLLALAADETAPSALRDKLHDVAVVLRAYAEWLERNGLHDSEAMLDAASNALRLAGAFPARGLQLWLDGFAEMTPQELQLLAAIVPLCERATLAFCLEAEPRDDDARSWLSLWSVVAQTFRRCRTALESLEGAQIEVKVLARDSVLTRFVANPVLAHVERHWARPVPSPESSEAPETLRTVTCANPEAEAVFAAREILRFVRESGARFRECAVLVRSLDGYHDTLHRVFTQYGVPFFLDRRESIAHHPLAELTRFATRLAAFGWRRDDWFGALKTGLFGADDEQLDQLENDALRHGWEGAQWTQPLPGKDGAPHRLETLRARLTAPFTNFQGTLAGEVTGAQLGTALRTLWAELDVEATLTGWSEETRPLAPAAALVHESSLAQMEEWLENVERAFRSTPMPLHDWLPVLEAGLAGLTVGVIPPALDQVLVGTIDRSRNPDLRLAIVLGMNETVFPAPPPRVPILTEAERELLANLSLRDRQTRAPAAFVGLTSRQRIAHERYFGYIACTRSRERLVLTCAAANSKGTALNPSPFLSHLESLVPGVFPAEARGRTLFSAPDWESAEHVSEIAPALIAGKTSHLAPLATIPPLADVVARAAEFKAAARPARLSPEITTAIYGSPFETSVSALEDFAACPYKFFLRHGLRLKEREEFEVDHRRKGTFQHEVLARFHDRATANKRKWRDWPPDAAAELVREIGREHLEAFERGLFNADDARRFAGEVLVENLARLVRTLVAWLERYRFDPQQVELSFGMPDSKLPGWTLPLGNGRALVLRGRIDRIDVCKRDDGTALGVVIDYKSSGKKVEAVKLHNGLELQLLSYLGFLQQLPATEELPQLTPAGVFYVSLRGGAGSAASRADAFDDPEARRRKAFRHEGRFNDGWSEALGATKEGEQFTTHYMTRLSPDAFAQLMRDVEDHLRRFGREILEGWLEIAPYRKSQADTACGRCEFGSVCRFDPWLEPYRALKPVPKKNAAANGRNA